MAAEKRASFKDSKVAPALCNILGTLLILAVFVLCLPITAPRIFGYEIYNVLSGSMEPAIPVGSVIYVEKVEPSQVEVDDVIAFHDGESVIAHRVVTNRTSLGEFVTKGDANDVEDFDPIPYDALIGRVALHLPLLGHAMSLYASNVGKVYLLLAFACGVMLNLLADRLREQQSVRARRALQAQRGAEAPEGEASAESAGSADSAAATGSTTAPTLRKRRTRLARTIIMAVLAAIFVCSAGVVGYVMHGYDKAEKLYDEAAQRYATKRETSEKTDSVVPIQVDFDALRAQNPDIIGWIYCPGTVINYPVLHGKDNDQYLHHDYQGNYDFAGSIFIESTNKPDFSDAKTIVYGHHLLTELMFSCLENWQEQSFYEQHPVMWLLTPTGDYQVILVSGHHLSAYSDLYQIITEPGDQMNAYVNTVTAESDFKPIEGVQANPSNRYVMLSTCAYIFDNARYALHGMLVPTGTVGGVAQN